MRTSVVAVLCAGLAACSSGTTAAPGSSPSPSPEVVTTTGDGDVGGFKVIRTLRPRGGSVQSVAMFGTWVVWSAAGTAAAPASPGTAAAQPDRVVAYDTATGRTVVVPRHAATAIPNLATGAGDRLLDREITPVAPQRCAGASPYGCFEWRIWTVDLRTGGPGTLLAASSAPGPQTSNPIPVAADGAVAWQEVDARGRVSTVVDRPEGGARRVAATGPAASQLSIDGGALYLDDGTTQPPRLLRVALPDGRPVEQVHGPKFYRPRAAAGQLTLVSGVPTEGMSVLLASLASPARTRPVFRSNEVYNAWPLGPDTAVVLDFAGLHVARVGAAARPIPIEVTSGGSVTVAGGVLAALMTDVESGAATITLVDVSAA